MLLMKAMFLLNTVLHISVQPHLSVAAQGVFPLFTFSHL